jgi:hypothetical protein
MQNPFYFFELYLIWADPFSKLSSYFGREPLDVFSLGAL